MLTDKTETILKNLSELNLRADILAEQRTLLISQLSREILACRSDLSAESAYALFLKETREVSTIRDKIEFCRNLCRNMGVRELSEISPFADFDIAVEAGSHEKIAIVKNNYNNRACELFSKVIPRAKTVCCQNFEECCETVAGGECEFTILPIEDNSDGKMFGFYSLLDRFELRIYAVCNIESESKTIRYALAGRSFQYREFDKNQPTKIRFFEFSLTYDTDFATPDIFEAAALCHADIHKTASLSLPYNDMITRFYFSFRITQSTELFAFLMFLWLEYPQYTPIGIYCEI